MSEEKKSLKEESKELTLSEKMELLIQKLDEAEEKKKAKDWKPQWWRFEFWKVALLPRVRKGSIIVQYLPLNGRMKIKIMKIEDFTAIIKEVYHSVEPDTILMWGRYPWVIIPSWSDKPFSVADHYQKAKEEGTLTTGQQYILAKMKKDAIKNKMNINWGLIILLVVGAVVLYFVLKSLGVNI